MKGHILIGGIVEHLYLLEFIGIVPTGGRGDEEILWDGLIQ